MIRGRREMGAAAGPPPTRVLIVDDADTADPSPRVGSRGRDEDFQSRAILNGLSLRAPFGQSAQVSRSDNSLAVTAVSAMSVIAGTLEHGGLCESRIVIQRATMSSFIG
jgi:hypothetical protein